MVGEIAAHRMVVALNKTDLLPEVVRPKAVKKATKLIRETLAATKFAGAAVIPVSAKPSKAQLCSCGWRILQACTPSLPLHRDVAYYASNGLPVTLLSYDLVGWSRYVAGVVARVAGWSVS